MKEAWLGDADRVGQKMTHTLWRPGYGLDTVRRHIFETLNFCLFFLVRAGGGGEVAIRRAAQM